MEKHAPTSEHNFLKKISKMDEAAKLEGKTVLVSNVTHEPWCNKLLRAGNCMCNCDPEIAGELIDRTIDTHG